MRISFLGAGAVATALSELFIRGGHETRVSSRHPQHPTLSFADAVNWGAIIVIAIPYNAVEEILPSLASDMEGKIVIDVTNPLGEGWAPLMLGAERSAGEIIAELLPGARVVKAFNSVFADVMTPERLVRAGGRTTAFIAADDGEAAHDVAELAVAAGFAPVYTGPLSNARYLEAMAHLNTAIAAGQGGGTNAAFIYDQAAH